MAKLKKTSLVSGGTVPEKDQPVNKYFIRISDRFMRAKYFMIAALAIFIAFFMILFRENITYANLMYLLRDLNTGDAVYTSGFDPIKYDEQENMTFSLYRDELAVAGNRYLKLYSSNGEENRSYELGYSNPAMVSSDKYLLLYDIGADTYSLFTSLTKVNSGTAEGRIEGAHVNSKGEHLLVCKSAETKYVICTFDSSFRPIAKYYKNRYVTSSVIGNDGSVVVSSFNSDGTGYDCEIELYRDGDESPTKKYTSPGVFPLKSGMWDNGSYYVVCTDRTLFFDNNGELINSIDNNFGYTTFAQGKNTIALSSNVNALGDTSKVFVYNTEGKPIYENKVDGSVSSIAVSANEVFVLSGSKVYMMPLDNSDIMSVDYYEGGDVIFSAGTSAIVCSRNGSEGIVFGADEENVSSTTETDS